MTTLALDTCFAACSAALSWSDEDGETVCVSRYERMQKGHAERLIPMIGEVMAAAPFGLDRVRRIVVTEGPGTFTGVRIGIAAARSLALANGARIETLSSLELMARTAVGCGDLAAPGEDIAVAVDARRDQVYFQLFDGAGLGALTEPLLVTPENAVTLTKSGGTVVLGSGAEALAAAALRAGHELRTALPDLEPDARFAVSSPAVEADRDAPRQAPPRPLYLRPPDAKPQDGKQLARVP